MELPVPNILPEFKNCRSVKNPGANVLQLQDYSMSVERKGFQNKVYE
jgi:hypothetical protein